MFRMTRLADYGIVLLTYMAGGDRLEPHNAKDLAARSHIPLPMVTKILKILAREGVLGSHRGTKGGYTLARPAEQLSVADIIDALEGPVALTACIVGQPGECEHEQVCPVQGHVQRINHAIRDALSKVTLRQLCQPPSELRVDGFVPLESLLPARQACAS